MRRAERRTPASANEIQVGGNHYKQFVGLEPWDAITHWGLGFLDGNAVKYLARWRHKGGLQDLEKAQHYIQKQIEVEKRRQQIITLLKQADKKRK